MNLFSHPGQYRNALGGGTVVYARRTGSEGEHDDGCGDDEHARDNLHTQFHTVLTTVQDSIEETHEDAVFILVVVGNLLYRLHFPVDNGRIQLRESLQATALHDAGGDDGAAEGTEQTHQRTGDLSVSDHGDDHHEAHAESRTEVGQGDELVFLEVSGETAVLGQGDDGRVIGKEGHDGTQGRYTGQVVQGLHQGTQEAFQQGNHAEFRHQFGQGTGEHGNAHQVEHRVQQQVMGRVHQGLDHVAAAHFGAQQAEETDKEGQENQGLNGRTTRFAQFHVICALATQMYKFIDTIPAAPPRILPGYWIPYDRTDTVTEIHTGRCA